MSRTNDQKSSTPAKVMIVNHESRLHRLTYYGTPVKAKHGAPASVPVEEILLAPGINMIDGDKLAKTQIIPPGVGYGPVPGFRSRLSTVDYTSQEGAWRVASYLAESASAPALRELAKADIPAELSAEVKAQLEKLEAGRERA